MTASPTLAALRPPRHIRVNVRTTSRVFLRNAPVLAAGGAFVAVLVLLSGPGARTPHLFVGVGLGMLACVLSFAVDFSRLPGAAATAVPLLNLVALGVLEAGGIPVSMLTVLPVLTLAVSHGSAGALAGVVGGTLVAWTPMLLDPVPVGPAHLPSLLLVPIVLVTVGFTVTGAERRARARSSLLRRQDGALQELLDDLVAERETLQGILAVLPAGVVVLDGSRVVLANPRGARLLAPAGHPVDRESREQEAESEADATASPLSSVLGRAVAGEAITAETHAWVEPDGTRSAIRTTTATLPGRSGRAPLRVVLLEDLTQEDRAIQQREDFVRAVSHELRTPLTSVVGYLDLARDVPDVPDDVHELLEIADRSAHRVLRLADDMMVASRLRTGPLRVDLAATDLSELVRSRLEETRYAAEVGGIVLVDATEGPCLVQADEARLRQAIDNVLSNAVLYSHVGGVVTVATRTRGDHAVVEVLDEGIGIRPEDRARVFDRFFRAPAVVRGSRHGTGLGLHVAREIVVGHGGDIAIRSTPGEGTRVEILLPAVVHGAAA
ncbi:hypothetical protein C8046_16010 [Serinibacter arcticus]|uniref:histidine kinase n=1 Tax=Serinibacter arcticus TaxID=1655435 RepID=A0A2U1ZY85_9MICO|nr:ATP-binding protein [Serinibacter arcticus]PWD51924.1 hypothetical protein C8046_16010 [Serinibacter arcticus]